MRKRAVGDLLGFFVVPLIGSAASFVAIPFLISAGGPSGWGAIAIAQGIGATAALVVVFGWGTTGPSDVAQVGPTEQAHIYWVSCVMRCLVLIVTMPIALLLSALIVSESFRLAAVLVCAAMVSQGLTPGWFLTGQRRPFAIALYETGPRAIAQLCAVALVGVSAQLWAYGAVILTAELTIAVVAFLALGQRSGDSRSVVHEVGQHVRQQWPLALSALVGAGYTRAAVPVVALAALGAVPVYAALDRIQQVARMGIRPFTSFFQGWVVADGIAAHRRRAGRATVITVAMGACIGVGVWIVLPVVGQLVFTKALTIDSAQSALLGLTIFFVSCSMSTGLYYLVPLKAISVFSWVSAGGSLFGVPLLLAMSAVSGATGAIGAVATVEGGVVLAQAIFVRRLLSRPAS